MLTLPQTRDTGPIYRRGVKTILQNLCQIPRCLRELDLMGHPPAGFEVDAMRSTY